MYVHHQTELKSVPNIYFKNRKSNFNRIYWQFLPRLLRNEIPCRENQPSLCRLNKYPAKDGIHLRRVLGNIATTKKRLPSSWYTHNKTMDAQRRCWSPSVALSTGTVARFNISQKNANNLITTPKECVYFPVLILLSQRYNRSPETMVEAPAAP